MTIDNTNAKIILTGDRPTGHLHIGHYVGSLKERVRLQNEMDYGEFIIMIADTQALTDNFNNISKVRDNVLEVALDYLSVGLDPKKCTICIQSLVEALPELTMYFMNLVTLPRLLRNPTVKSELKQKNFSSQESTQPPANLEGQSGVPIGFITYPISQAADILAFKATAIPVGEDQQPMLEQTREISRKFNKTYHTELFSECQAILPSNNACKRLPGIDGNIKMSKSLHNCIYLVDDDATLRKKINSIPTFPRAIEDPGILEDNTLFIYVEALATEEHFTKFYTEYKNVVDLKKAYKKGGIGDGRIKKFLFEVLQDILRPIRERRHSYEGRITEVLEMLKDGSAHANAIANETLLETKRAMKIDYFSPDSTYKTEMSKKFKKKI